VRITAERKGGESPLFHFHRNNKFAHLLMNDCDGKSCKYYPKAGTLGGSSYIVRSGRSSAEKLELSPIFGDISPGS
jgi:hypothetical protein